MGTADEKNIHCWRQSLYVCLLYRPPSEQQVLDTLFSTLCTLNSNVFYLVGDFNIDVSNHNHPLFSKLFLYHLVFFLLYQVVKSFTHFRVGIILL